MRILTNTIIAYGTFKINPCLEIIIEITTTENVSHNKGRILGDVHVKIHPDTINLIKFDVETKSEKDLIKIKLYRNTISDTLYLYEFKMVIFENGKPE